jgi:hypothetical protein
MARRHFVAEEYADGPVTKLLSVAWKVLLMPHRLRYEAASPGFLGPE